MNDIKRREPDGLGKIDYVEIDPVEVKEKRFASVWDYIKFGVRESVKFLDGKKRAIGVICLGLSQTGALDTLPPQVKTVATTLGLLFGGVGMADAARKDGTLNTATSVAKEKGGSFWNILKRIFEFIIKLLSIKK